MVVQVVVVVQVVALQVAAESQPLVRDRPLNPLLILGGEAFAPFGAYTPAHI